MPCSKGKLLAVQQSNAGPRAETEGSRALDPWAVLFVTHMGWITPAIAIGYGLWYKGIGDVKLAHDLPGTLGMYEHTMVITQVRVCTISRASSSQHQGFSWQSSPPVHGCYLPICFCSFVRQLGCRIGTRVFDNVMVHEGPGYTTPCRGRWE